MIPSQWMEAVAEACKGMAFEPTVRMDIQTVGSARYADCWVRDTRTGKMYSTGGRLDFGHSFEQAVKHIRARLDTREAELQELWAAEKANEKHRLAMLQRGANVI